ncbi:unnamed protein product [Calypogeia fissa]
MVVVTLEDFNSACKVDVDVTQHVPPPKLDADGNPIDDKPPLSGDEQPDVRANLKAVEWADEVQVSLFGEGHILRTRDLLERQLESYYQWIHTPEPPAPPKDPNIFIDRVIQLKIIDQKVAQGYKEPPSSAKDDRNFSEQQSKAYKAWQDTDVYPRYVFLHEEYLESLKPPPPPRDWSSKEYPDLLELQNEQYLLWYKTNQAYLENLLKPEIPVDEIPPPPPPPPPPPKDVNIYIRKMEKMIEEENYWKIEGPYVFWPNKYDPTTYYLELQRYWMGKWEYTDEYIALCRGVIRKKVKTLPWRKLKWWEWKPVSNIYKEEREPKNFDYGGLPKRPLSAEYKERGMAPGMEKPEDEEGDENVTTPTSVLWDITTKAPYKSIVYNTELAEEPTKMPENRIFWEKEPRPVDMDAIYKETYEVIVKTQPNFI